MLTCMPASGCKCTLFYPQNHSHVNRNGRNPSSRKAFRFGNELYYAPVNADRILEDREPRQALYRD